MADAYCNPMSEARHWMLPEQLVPLLGLLVCSFLLVKKSLETRKETNSMKWQGTVVVKCLIICLLESMKPRRD